MPKKEKNQNPLTSVGLTTRTLSILFSSDKEKVYLERVDGFIRDQTNNRTRDRLSLKSFEIFVYSLNTLLKNVQKANSQSIKTKKS